MTSLTHAAHQGDRQPAADRRMHRLAGPLTSSDLASLDPHTLAAGGCQSLVFGEPVRLGADEKFDTYFLVLLREAISATVRIAWTAADLALADTSLVHHLPPPMAGGQASSAWRAGYRFGSCYYRMGPGFVLIKDVREERGARYQLDQPEAVAAFPELERPLHLPSATAAAHELFGLLEGERLAMRHGAWGMLLPFRMRRWPVPFNAV